MLIPAGFCEILTAVFRVTDDALSKADGGARGHVQKPARKKM
jgi:hypothetical protein